MKKHIKDVQSTRCNPETSSGQVVQFKKTLSILILFFFFLSSFSFEFVSWNLELGACFAQNVAINATGNAPNASAGLDIDFTNKGLLIPRMLAAQKTAIVSPVNGLLIYQTDAPIGFWYYDAAIPVWTQLGSTGGGGGFSNMQVFTASGSFTIPAGITKIMVEVRGGGGGGGKGDSGPAFGQGGSGGGYGKEVFTVVPATVYAVTVGAGGIGSTGGSCTVGGVGATSSFGALISATGGGGGGGCGNTSTPGSSTAALNMTGFVGWQLFLSSPRNEGGACGDGSTIGSGGQGAAFFGNDGKAGNVVVYW